MESAQKTGFLFLGSYPEIQMGLDAPGSFPGLADSRRASAFLEDKAGEILGSVSSWSQEGCLGGYGDILIP